MLNPQSVINYDLEDHRGILSHVAGRVEPFPGGGTVFPLPMHTIYAAQHPREPMLLPVHLHQILAVFGGRASKILLT